LWGPTGIGGVPWGPNGHKNLGGGRNPEGKKKTHVDCEVLCKGRTEKDHERRSFLWASGKFKNRGVNGFLGGAGTLKKIGGPRVEVGELWWGELGREGQNKTKKKK